jgi:hypothetical protein
VRRTCLTTSLTARTTRRVAWNLPQKTSDRRRCDEAVQQFSRHDLAQTLAPRYVQASKGEKGQLPDEFWASPVIAVRTRWCC